MHAAPPAIPHTDRGSGWDWPRYRSPVGGSSGGGGGSPGLTWPLVVYGNNGQRVKTIQYLLQQRGYSLTADGDFGNGTLSAARNFQGSHGLGADGQVGNAAWPALTPVHPCYSWRKASIGSSCAARRAGK